MLVKDILKFKKKGDRTAHWVKEKHSPKPQTSNWPWASSGLSQLRQGFGGIQQQAFQPDYAMITSKRLQQMYQPGAMITATPNFQNSGWTATVTSTTA